MVAGTPDYAYKAPYFVSHVLSILSDRLGPELVMRGGLKIYTTMDLRLQEKAEAMVKKGVAEGASELRPASLGKQ